MNTPEKEEHDHLEEVTRPTFLDRRVDATEQVDDDESSRLREGWRPFCELLRTVHSTLELPEEGPFLLQVRRHVKRRQVRRRIYQFGFAGAAVVLYALGLSTLFHSSKGRPKSPAIVQSDEKQRKDVASASVEQFDWEGDVDKQIAMARTNLRRFQSDWQRAPSAFESTRSQLDELKQRIDQNLWKE